MKEILGKLLGTELIMLVLLFIIGIMIVELNKNEKYLRFVIRSFIFTCFTVILTLLMVIWI